MTISHFCLFQAYRSFPSCVSTALASQTHWIFKDEQPQQYLSSDSHPTHSPGWMTVAQPQLSQLTALTPPKSSRRCRPPLREGLYRHNTFPSPASSEPRTAGPRREQPARRAAFPPPRSPRALPAAFHGRTAARQPGTGDAPPRPVGLRHPRTTRVPRQAMRRPPRSLLLPRPHHHCRAPPHLSGAERPCRSTQHRGGSASCPPCLPSAAAAAPAATPSPAGSGAPGRRKGRGGAAGCAFAFCGVMLPGGCSEWPFRNPARCGISHRGRLVVCFLGDAPQPIGEQPQRSRGCCSSRWQQSLSELWWGYSMLYGNTASFVFPSTGYLAIIWSTLVRPGWGKAGSFSR